jgi:hypothetical protein
MVLLPSASFYFDLAGEHAIDKVRRGEKMPGLARIVQHAPVQLADLEAYAVRLEHARVLRITEVDANFDRLLPGQIGLRGRDGQDKGGNAVELNRPSA